MQTASVDFTVNGQPHQLDLDVSATLLDTLRERLRLTGTKKGCDHGQCGACTVLVDGRRINSCLTLAVMQQGRSITTIEGLEQQGALHAVQQAFIEHDAFQCGYCTPGQICSAVALLSEEPLKPFQSNSSDASGKASGRGKDDSDQDKVAPAQANIASGMDAAAPTSPEEKNQTEDLRAVIREFMSGNLCRCGAYTNIVDAIESVIRNGARGLEK